jgi:hypothetical protein
MARVSSSCNGCATTGISQLSQHDVPKDFQMSENRKFQRPDLDPDLNFALLKKPYSKSVLLQILYNKKCMYSFNIFKTKMT